MPPLPEGLSSLAGRVLHVVVDDIPAGIEPFDREAFQRDVGSLKALALLGARPHDLLLHTDADEILRAATLREMVECEEFRLPGVVALAEHRYRFNWRSGGGHEWVNPVLTTVGA